MRTPEFSCSSPVVARDRLSSPMVFYIFTTVLAADLSGGGGGLVQTAAPHVGAAWHHQLDDNNDGTAATHFADPAGTNFNTNLDAIAKAALELNTGGCCMGATMAIHFHLAPRWFRVGIRVWVTAQGVGANERHE